MSRLRALPPLFSAQADPFSLSRRPKPTHEESSLQALLRDKDLRDGSKTSHFVRHIVVQALQASAHLNGGSLTEKAIVEAVVAATGNSAVLKAVIDIIPQSARDTVIRSAVIDDVKMKVFLHGCVECVGTHRCVGAAGAGTFLAFHLQALQRNPQSRS